MQFTEPFEGQDEADNAETEMDEIASMFGSDMEGSKAGLQSTVLNKQNSSKAVSQI